MFTLKPFPPTCQMDDSLLFRYVCWFFNTLQIAPAIHQSTVWLEKRDPPSGWVGSHGSRGLAMTSTRIDSRRDRIGRCCFVFFFKENIARPVIEQRFPFPCRVTTAQLSKIFVAKIKWTHIKWRRQCQMNRSTVTVLFVRVRVVFLILFFDFGQHPVAVHVRFRVKQMDDAIIKQRNSDRARPIFSSNWSSWTQHRHTLVVGRKLMERERDRKIK